jgi:hypothetical protein
MLSPFGPALQLHGGSKLISASSCLRVRKNYVGQHTAAAFK